jgi:adenylate cyclase
MGGMRTIRLYEKQRLLFMSEFSGAWELGRQDEGEEAPFARTTAAGRCRLVIGRREETSISRRHVHLAPLSDGYIRVSNLSTTLPIHLADGSKIDPGGTCELAMPLLLGVGRKLLRIERDEEPSSQPGAGTLSEPTRPPGQGPLTTSRFPTGVGSGEGREVLRWLRDTMSVFLSAATSAEFFDRAAQAIVEAVGLDCGQVLILDDGEWQRRACWCGPALPAEAARPPSRTILDRVYLEKRVFWQAPLPSDSLEGVAVVVAAPILDREGNLVGVLYGDRMSREGPVTPLTELDGLLTEVLAGGVAAGLARLHQEREALEARVRFEQFFTPELAHQLTCNPNLLSGQDSEVSILFCDLRRFSSISERLGPGKTVAWLNDVMETLSRCVQAQRGVLVDYIGDELLAMWGAPEPDPEHPRRACHAALAMLEELPALNARWEPILGEPMGLGIGINTGLARVGNMGSQRKFKYGPLGNEVNLASRIQGATKYFKCPLLITGATQARLGEGFATRRLCTVRVVNIATPVDVYELVQPGRPDWPAARVEYEKALAAFEAKQFSSAARTMGNWRMQYPTDGPALLLLARAVNCMVEEPPVFDPVWVLPSK